MRQRQIELHIDELTITDSAGIDRDRFRASLEGRLIDLLTTGSTTWAGGHRDFAQANIQHAARSEDLGVSVGNAIGGVLNNE